jgi:hypothetical protein
MLKQNVFDSTGYSFVVSVGHKVFPLTEHWTRMDTGGTST